VSEQPFVPGPLDGAYVHAYRSDASIARTNTGLEGTLFAFEQARRIASALDETQQRQTFPMTLDRVR
jgi:hypothetical protein